VTHQIKERVSSNYYKYIFFNLRTKSSRNIIENVQKSTIPPYLRNYSVKNFEKNREYRVSLKVCRKIQTKLLSIKVLTENRIKALLLEKL